MTSSTAIFATSDIGKTLAYYKDVLGFETTWTYGEPANFGGASKGGVSIMFCLQPDLAPNVNGHQHWINVDDADEAFEAHQASGAKVVEDIEDRPWGFREYVVEDLNGYRLRIAGPLSSQAPKSQPFPKGVLLERRKPSPAEFDAVTQKTYDNQGVDFGQQTESVLERSWSGVVALSPSGEPVGVLRIMHDAPGWFSIWDVAVMPKWQAKRIGTKMMEEALKIVHDETPGALVFLFTVKHGFYQRLGFSLGSASMRKV